MRDNTPEGAQVNAEAGANARLIAAAPELLASLLELREMLAAEGRAWAATYPQSVPWVNGAKLVRADEAIGKAEGL